MNVEERCEMYRRQLGGVNAANNRKSQRIRELEKRVAELEAATLGGGKLTAEQVREAVMSADRWEKPMGDTGLTNTHLIIRDDGWQAIADELNATLGGVECDVKWHDIEYNGEADEWTCLSCGERWMQETDWPAACPWCGKAVKR